MSYIIHFILDLQSNIKLYHWMTTSFARHKAADELVEKIMEYGDEFIETYIGRYGRPTMSKQSSTIALQHYDDRSVNTYLETCIQRLLREFPKHLNKDDVDLFNIRDEIVGVLNRTKYLFTLS